jgi:hypothetical protein
MLPKRVNMTTPDTTMVGDPEGLRERAERYRKMAMEITDDGDRGIA